MKDYFVYAAVSMSVFVVALFLFSGQIAPTLVAVALMIALRLIYTSPRGRRWWQTWMRMGTEFDKYLSNQADNN